MTCDSCTFRVSRHCPTPGNRAMNDGFSWDCQFYEDMRTADPVEDEYFLNPYRSLVSTRAPKPSETKVRM